MKRVNIKKVGGFDDYEEEYVSRSMPKVVIA